MWTAAPARAVDPVIAAAGDIACDPADAAFNAGAGSSTLCHQKYTSDLLVNQGLSAVLPVGDLQYACPGAAAFAQSYDPTWGRLKSITFPATGNHEYYTTANATGTGCDATADADGYFSYFGAKAGDPAKGYYSYDIGTWHLVALNTNNNCAVVACGAGSAQELWLKADLAAHPNACTLAYFHYPVFSSKTPLTFGQAFWQDLYNAGAEVVLDGHVHNYERFAPQTPAGVADPANGIREFVVGTGGKSLEAFATTIQANSEVRLRTFGVLKLTLHPTSYDWQFVPDGTSGNTAGDGGSGTCHGAPGGSDTTPPTVSVTAPADGATVSGTTTISADAADAGGVNRVEFLVDNALVGTDTTAPYSIAWDSTTVANGTRTVSARAFDATGNQSTAAVTVTTSNAAPPAGQITRRAQATNSGTSSGTRITIPAQVVAGDAMVVMATTSSSSATFPTNPAGWTRIANSKAVDFNSAAWYRVAQAGDAGTTVSFPTSSTTDYWTIGLVAYANTNAPTPLDLFATAASTGQVQSVTPGPIVPTQAGEMILSFAAADASSILTWTENAGTEIFDVRPTSLTIVANEQLQVTAASVSRTFTISSLPQELNGYIIALKPTPAAADTTPPVVGVTAPADGATVSGATTLSADATDAGGVNRVEFLVDGALVGTDTTAPYSLSWDSTTVGDGSRVIGARAFDATGNQATASVTVTVSNPADLVPPTVSVTAPADGATVSGTTTISASAADTGGSGVKQVQFLVDGAPVGAPDTVAPYSVSWSSSAVADGPGHTVTARAVDNASNQTDASVTVTVNNASPAQAIARRAQATSSGTANGTSITIPAQVVAGDVVVVMATTSSSSATFTTNPAGWTRIATSKAVDFNSAAWYHVAQAGDAGTVVSFPVSATTDYWTIGLVAYANTNTITPVDVFATAASTGQVQSVTPGPILPSQAGEMIVSFAAADVSSLRAWTEDAGTEIFDVQPTSLTVVANEQLQAASTSVARSLTISSLPQELNGYIIALKPK